MFSRQNCGPKSHFLAFSLTATALGPSGIVKVSGQNCFRTLWFSGADPSKGCQKVLRKVPLRFHQGSTNFCGVSACLGQIRLGLPKGSMEGSAKVSLRCHQGFTKVAQVSSCLRSSRFFAQTAFASQKVLWSVPQSVLHICLRVSCRFGVNGCCFRKGSVEGSPNYSLHRCFFIKSSSESSANGALHLSPSLFRGLREWLTCLNHNHTNPLHRKRPIMLLLLGHSLGLLAGLYASTRPVQHIAKCTNLKS